MSDVPGPVSAIRRRSFLAWISGIGATLTAALVGTPAIAAVVSPATRKPVPPRWVRVADDVSTLDVGVPIKADFVELVNDAWVESRALRSVWLYTEDGEAFTAYSGVCTHLGCSFGYDKDKQQYHCPCHHGLFDLKSGAVLGGPPPRPLDTLPVKVENGEVYVQYQSFLSGVSDKVQL